eukprot:1157343-Pelagomonas_calceolata.AAC.6
MINVVQNLEGIGELGGPKVLWSLTSKQEGPEAPEGCCQLQPSEPGNEVESSHHRYSCWLCTAFTSPHHPSLWIREGAVTWLYLPQWAAELIPASLEGSMRKQRKRLSRRSGHPCILGMQHEEASRKIVQEEREQQRADLNMPMHGACRCISDRHSFLREACLCLSRRISGLQLLSYAIETRAQTRPCMCFPSMYLLDVWKVCRRDGAGYEIADFLYGEHSMRFITINWRVAQAYCSNAPLLRCLIPASQPAPAHTTTSPQRALSINIPPEMVGAEAAPRAALGSGCADIPTPLCPLLDCIC